MYQWRAGSRHKVNADVAGALCERLEDEGRLTPRELLFEATPMNSPLHDEFEWDNNRAATEYRIYQARNIINSLTINISSEQKEPVRAFFNITKPNASYTSTKIIIQDQDSRQRLLNQALSELLEFQRKYQTLQELAPVFDGIKKVQTRSDQNVSATL